VNLKQKTVSGLLWSALDSFANQGLQFVVGIILARLVTPREFGLIGMISIFIAVSQAFINSGFSSALIRKKDCTQSDYSTVFYYNLTVGLIFYLIIFLLAGGISNFFNEPELKWLVRVLGFDLIIRSATIIQVTTLTKRVDFKLQAKITVISGILSGIIGIYMAVSGYGVWSLVARSLAAAFFSSLFLWLWNKWRPSLLFDKNSFKELFSFGGKLMLSGLIDTLFKNIYYLIIGKAFSAKDLGYYARADQFSTFPANNLMNIIGRVSYPVLSEVQNDIPRLKSNYQKLIKSTMFITFTLMLGMIAVAEPMIITLIGEQWRTSIVYLQLLCFVGMFYPLQALNLNMLKVQGRSDLFLKLEIVKKAIAIPVIIIGIFLGIKMMIVGMIFNSMIAYYLNSYWSGHMLGYSLKSQIEDILPSFALALVMAVLVFCLGLVLPLSHFWKLLVQVTTGAGFILIFSELTRFKSYVFIKEIALEKFRSSGITIPGIKM